MNKQSQEQKQPEPLLDINRARLKSSAVSKLAELKAKHGLGGKP